MSPNQQGSDENCFLFQLVLINSFSLANSPIQTEKFFRTGDKYVGEMLNGKMHGFGTYYFSSGSQLTCTFFNGMAIGKGKYEHPDGCIYTGEIYMSKKHGKGIEQFENGDYFCGEFENGERKKGVYKSLDGFEYEGSYVKNKMSGYGILKHKNGYFYQGQFENDQKQGEGIEYLPEQQAWNKGIWKNNEFMEIKQNKKQSKWKKFIAIFKN